MTFYSWVGSTARKWFGSLYVLQFNTNFSAAAILSAGRAFLQYNVQWFRRWLNPSKGWQPSTEWRRFRIRQECGYNNRIARISLWNHHQAFEETQIVAASWLHLHIAMHCHVAISGLAGFGIHFWWWFFSLQQINRLDLLLSVKSNKKKTTNLGTTTNSI